MPDLVFKIEEPGLAPREVNIQAGMRIGRDPASDCPLNDQNVSSRHAVIVEKAGVLVIEDVGSSNKTRVRGGPVLTKGESHPLTPGLVLGLGKSTLTVALKEAPRDIPGTDKVAQTGPDLVKTEAHAIHPYGEKAQQKNATSSENPTASQEALAKKDEAAAPDSEAKTSSKAAPIAEVPAAEKPAKAEKPAAEKAAPAPKEEKKPEAAKAEEKPATEKPKAAEAPKAAEKPAEAEPKKEAAAEAAKPAEPTAKAETPAVKAEAPKSDAPAASPEEKKPEAAKKEEAPAKAEPAKPAAPEAKDAPAEKPATKVEAKAEEAPAAKAETKAKEAADDAAAMKVKAAPEAAPAEAKIAEDPKAEGAPAEKPKEAPKPAPAKAAAKELPPLPEMKKGTKEPKDYVINRYEIDLGTYAVKHKVVPCEDFEDVLGGVARAFKTLQNYEVNDAYDPKAPLIMNLGLLSGTQFMTGLRTFFHGYSPLKASHDDKPSAMWTAGSGKFGTKVRYLGIDEIIFTGRAVKPVYLHISRPEGADKPKFSFKPADHLKGHHANQKIQHLYAKYPEAHFAVIGPAGENYEGVRFAAIALSTINQLRSGDMKSRFCGRGGFGGVMGSKNLLGIVADVKDQEREKVDGLKELNMIVARGEGSRRFRDKKKGDGGGGTWANMAALDPIDAMPEMNFNPTGTKESLALWRDSVEEAGKFLVKDEACFACGIACHKNLYENEDGKKGVFRAKFDYEPLNLLSANIGIMDIDQAATLVELVDDLCMDSISIGVTLSYAMEYNRRMKEAGEPSILPDYVRFGDFEGAKRAIEEMGTGKLAVLGQGSKRLSEALGETDFAMHCKGVEFPAYMPHVNPGYPWALAGGHMSMRTYLLYVFEREKSMDYWVDAITTRGPMIMRDDVLGVCKFSAMCDDHMAKALNAMTDLEISEDELKKVVMRTFLRGYRLEKKQGFDQRDYVMPGDALKPQPHMQLEHFNTPEFFAEMKEKVTDRFEKMLVEEGL